MRHFKSKWFNRWAKKNKLHDDDLYNAINNLIENKSTVKIGKYLYKVRVAQKKRGKSKSYRTIVIFITNVRSFFAYGFSKNERSSI
ncbi:MAG: type II toxin-antitoxin system RelE/ParE family toxin, partial [Chitinispirillia bacterium]